MEVNFSNNEIIVNELVLEDSSMTNTINKNDDLLTTILKKQKWWRHNSNDNSSIGDLGLYDVNNNSSYIDDICKKVFNFLASKAGILRINRNHIIGILANIYDESRFNPHVENSIGASGLCQWLGPRKAQYIKLYGHTPAQGSVEEQLNYLVWECQNTETNALSALRATNNAANAAYVWATKYERCESNVRERRMKHVNTIESLLKA